MKYLVESLKDVLEAATHYDRAGINKGKKVSKHGKVFIGSDYGGQRGTVIFIPDEESE